MVTHGGSGGKFGPQNLPTSALYYGLIIGCLVIREYRIIGQDDRKQTDICKNKIQYKAKTFLYTPSM